MFVCVECGSQNPHLCEQISPSVLKLSQCESCDSVVDKYIEYDGVLVLLDMLLLKTEVYRHVVFHRRQIGGEREVYTKYSNGTKPPPPCPSDSSSFLHYYTRTTILLFLSSLTADTYTTWLNDKPDGKLNLQVLELKFIVRLAEVFAQTCSFYLTVSVLCVMILGVRDVGNLLSSLVISSFAKLFAIPSAMWSQNTNLLILSYIFVLANNMVVIRVMSDKRIRSGLVVLSAFVVERYVSYKLCQNVWPWDTLGVYNKIFRGSNSSLSVNQSSLDEDFYWFFPPIGREHL